MLHGKVLYPPQFGATLASLDASAAEAMPGVKVVHEGDFVAVAAPEPETAAQGRGGAESGMETGDGARPTAAASSSISSGRREARRSGRTSRRTPSLTSRTCRWSRARPWPNGRTARLTVWTGTQRPFGVRGELAQAFGIAGREAHVIMPDTGSGYGGKHNGDAAIEAARMAKAVGKPVKRNWTREEEMTWAYFRPGGLIEVGGKVDAGRHHHRVGVSQLQLGRLRAAIALQHSPERRSSFTRRSRRCGRARTVAWRRRPTTSSANPTWTSWRNR